MTTLIGLSAVVGLVLQFLLPSDFLHLASTSHAIHKRLFTSETNVTLHESFSQLQQQQQTDSADDAEDEEEVEVRRGRLADHLSQHLDKIERDYKDHISSLIERGTAREDILFQDHRWAIVRSVVALYRDFGLSVERAINRTAEIFSPIRTFTVYEAGSYRPRSSRSVYRILADFRDNHFLGFTPDNRGRYVRATPIDVYLELKQKVAAWLHAHHNVEETAPVTCRSFMDFGTQKLQHPYSLIISRKSHHFVLL